MRALLCVLSLSLATLRSYVIPLPPSRLPFLSSALSTREKVSSYPRHNSVNYDFVG